MAKGMILTEAGREVLTLALTGKELKFTRGAVGDGVPAGNADLYGMSSLVNEKMSLEIQVLKKSTTGRAECVFSVSNETSAQGFFLNEYGLFAENPETHQEVLYAYCAKDPGKCAYLEGFDGTNPVTFTLTLATVIDRAENVSAVVDNTNIYIQVQGLKERIEACEESEGDAGALLSSLPEAAGGSISSALKYAYFHPYHLEGADLWTEARESPNTGAVTRKMAAKNYMPVRRWWGPAKWGSPGNQYDVKVQGTCGEYLEMLKEAADTHDWSKIYVGDVFYVEAPLWNYRAALAPYEEDVFKSDGTEDDSGGHRYCAFEVLGFEVFSGVWSYCHPSWHPNVSGAYTHHAVIGQYQGAWGGYSMADSNNVMGDIAAKGYANSSVREMLNTGLYGVLCNIFGQERILRHREPMSTAVSSGAVSGVASVEAKVELMDAEMYRGIPYGNGNPVLGTGVLPGRRYNRMGWSWTSYCLLRDVGTGGKLVETLQGNGVRAIGNVSVGHLPFYFLLKGKDDPHRDSEGVLS